MKPLVTHTRMTPQRFREIGAFFKKLDNELMLLTHEFINAAGNERNGVSIYLRRARAKLRMVDDNLGIARSLAEECLCISHPRESIEGVFYGRTRAEKERDGEVFGQWKGIEKLLNSNCEK